MHFLPGYKIHGLVHECNSVQIFRGQAVEIEMPVFIKVLDKEKADPAEMSMFLNEYETLRKLSIDGIIKPVKIEQYGLNIALIMEDPGVLPLREYIKNHSIDLYGFLKISVQLAETLGQLHMNRLVHLSLNPENILIHPETEKSYITGFGKASVFPLVYKNYGNLEVSPEYISPERTGLLNTVIDQRSDLYSLGVIFYEILTGQLPFQAETSEEWMHAHLSRKPEPPDKIMPGIPEVVSAIIMKLLSKNADERYQDAYGLLWDLKECDNRLYDTGEIEYFPIGQKDAPAGMRMPSILYDREKEKELLKTAYEDVCKGKTRTVIISGHPGVGKTMLVVESFKAATSGKGYFIMGKFDQLGQNIPYAPFSVAFGNLVRQLMTESQERLEQWKKKIQRALGQNGAVITEVIPEVEWIIGKQPQVSSLSPKESENRFLLIFRDFVRVFTGKDHPLVLFLDDLQWADSASVKLLKYLITDSSLESLLITGAYREIEAPGHPLAVMLEEISKGYSHVTQLRLMPLELAQIREIVTDIFHSKTKSAFALAETLYHKSAGNPFLLGQLLVMIYEEGHIYFNAKDGRWKWNLEAIQKLQLTEDVLEILLKKLQRLPEDTREILKLASCIGNSFDLETLAYVYGKNMDETATALMLPIREGFILEKGNRHDKNIPVYEFAHDRIQQAVYALLREKERKEKHIAIGRLLINKMRHDGPDDMLLSAIDHFDRGLELITDLNEKIELARYNLAAGKKVKAQAAFTSALQYFRSAKALLPDDLWERDYKLSYELFLELAQAEYLSGDVKAAEDLFDIIIEKTRDETERASIYGLKVTLYAGMGKYDEAVQTGIGALEKLGMKIPVYPKKEDYLKEMLLFKWHMRNKSIEDLISMPEIKDPVQRKISELLARLCSIALVCNPELYGYVLLKTGNHALQYGNTEMSLIGYSGFGIISSSVLGDYKSGESFGKLCLKLMERYSQSTAKCIAYFVIGAFITHWTQHTSVTMEYLEKAAQYAIEAGDILILGYAQCLLLELYYLLGNPLEKVAEEAREKFELAVRLKHDSLALNAAVYGKVVSVLTGMDEDIAGQGGKSLEDGAREFHSEDFEISQYDKASMATFYLYKMQLSYMAGNYRDALYAAENFKPFAKAILGFMTTTEYNFYYSLAITAAFDDLPAKEKRIYWNRLKMNQNLMKKWAHSCKENFLHKYLLVAAEMVRLQNKREEAMSLYEQAIQMAGQNGFVQHEALAYELASRFYLSAGNRKIAVMYMAEACRCYNKWGTFAKVRELERQLPELSEYISENERFASIEADINMRLLNSLQDGLITTSASREPESETETASGQDLIIIEKAVEKIAGEPDLKKLLDSFLELACQSTGANKGYLIVRKNEDLVIAAGNDETLSLTDKVVPLEECALIAKTVVRYVARTLETVVLNSGEKTGVFKNDPYLERPGSWSIACLPLLLQGMPVGVFYVENSFLHGIFTSEKIKLLKLLSTHIVLIKELQTYLGEHSTAGKEDVYLLEPLTEREMDVLNLIAKGMSNKEIAYHLEITINTVKGYIKNLYAKLGVNKRLQAVTKARELKILKKN